MGLGTATAWLRTARRMRSGVQPSGTLAVVGFGMAAHRLCARLLEPGAPRPQRVVVIGEEARPAYDRVHLSDSFAGRALSELELAPEAWYRERGIELWLADPVAQVDAAKQRLETRGGRTLGFDALVFATGSQALRPPLPGIDLPGVHVYRSADDVEAIRAAASAAGQRGGRAAVLGGGLLGIEAAYAMQRLGCEVEVIERAAHLLPRQLDAVAARVLEQQIRALGIRVTLARNLTAIERSPGGLRLVGGGDGAEFAFVVVAAGVRPRDELARACGIACHPRGGILVDDGLACSEAGIYAIGECARHQGVVYGLAAPCLGMADVLADRLRGGSRRFRRVPAATRLKLDCVDVSVAGEAHLDGHGVARITHASGSEYRSLVLREWHVVGAVAVGEWSEWHRVQEAIARQRLLLPWQRLRLARRGNAFGASGGAPISRWPDATTVCTCIGVDCGALRFALAEGCRSAAELGARTGAGSVCGTCRPLLEALCGERADTARESAGGGLLPAGVAASALVALLALAPPIALATSVQGGGFQGLQLDALWRDSQLRQITGFTTLAVCAASLLFSLRKRWRLLTRLSYARWRGVHALLGVAALIGLGAHTGFRLGANLDRALVLCFLALAALGALAGVTTALERRLSQQAGVFARRTATLLHTAAFWPFPVLVLFHVLKTYWY